MVQGHSLQFPCIGPIFCEVSSRISGFLIGQASFGQKRMFKWKNTVCKFWLKNFARARKFKSSFFIEILRDSRRRVYQILPRSLGWFFLFSASLLSSRQQNSARNFSVNREKNSMELWTTPELNRVSTLFSSSPWLPLFLLTFLLSLSDSPSRWLERSQGTATKKIEINETTNL